MKRIRNKKGSPIALFSKNLRKVMVFILIISTMVIMLKLASAEIFAESDHPYANNYANTWTISEPGASQIRIHFTKIDLLSNDYVRILDKDGNQLVIYGGDSLNVNYRYLKEDYWTEWFVGDTLKVKFTTNGVGTSYGFLVDQKETRETSLSSTPISTPASASISTPASAPISTPAFAPISTPAPAPISTPASISISTPASISISTPASASISTPAPTPISSSSESFDLLVSIFTILGVIIAFLTYLKTK